MKRIVWVTLCLLITMAVSAQEKRILRGFDGGMMVHTGYLSGNLDAIGYKAQGAPMGIGGVIRLHLGDHFRIGSEGYVSTLSQRGNGSYLKCGWPHALDAQGGLPLRRRQVKTPSGWPPRLYRLLVLSLKKIRGLLRRRGYERLQVLLSSL